MIADPENDGAANQGGDAGVSARPSPYRGDATGNRRNGKVARLDAKLREIVNQMMLDGATYPQIIAELAGRGVPDISEDNLSRWFHGGHKDWLKQQQRLADMKSRQEFALQIVQGNKGGTIHEAASQIAASTLYEAVADFDPALLKDLLATEPENYAKIVTSLARLGEGALKYEKYRDLVKAQKEKIAAEIDKSRTKGGLTPETINRIEQELRLL